MAHTAIHHTVTPGRSSPLGATIANGGVNFSVFSRNAVTIEMAEAAGAENLFLFGLTAEQVESNRGWYDPRWRFENEPETRSALDLIAGNHFSRNEPGIFTPILDVLLQYGDRYRHLADLASYAQAQQSLGELFTDQQVWPRIATLNIAASGKFSSDRTIAEYAKEIWNVEPCLIQ